MVSPASAAARKREVRWHRCEACDRVWSWGRGHPSRVQDDVPEGAAEAFQGFRERLEESMLKLKAMMDAGKPVAAGDWPVRDRHPGSRRRGVPVGTCCPARLPEEWTAGRTEELDPGSWLVAADWWDEHREHGMAAMCRAKAVEVETTFGQRVLQRLRAPSDPDSGPSRKKI